MCISLFIVFRNQSLNPGKKKNNFTLGHTPFYMISKKKKKINSMKCEPIHFLCNIEFFFRLFERKEYTKPKTRTKEGKKKKITNEEIFWEKNPSFKTTRII